MKALLLISIVVLSSCGPQSSPDGRSRSRDQAIQRQIDSLKSQNKILTDSMAHISMELKALQHK